MLSLYEQEQAHYCLPLSSKSTRSLGSLCFPRYACRSVMSYSEAELLAIIDAVLSGTYLETFISMQTIGL